MKDSIVVVYIPAVGEYGSWYLEQFLGLYYSVVHKTELHERFDFLVTGPVDILSQIPPDHCKFVPLDDLTERPEFRYKYSGSPYGFAGSFAPFIDDACLEIIHQYKYALRIDVDTFLCPSMYYLRPREGLLAVGNAAYASETARVKLPEIQNKLGLSDRGLFNVGSTWYGDSQLITSAGSKTLEYVKYFLAEEFADGQGEWPQWFAGVILLYSAHLAVNELSEDEVPNILQSEKFDFHSSSEESVSSDEFKVFSIHCWHGPDYFSKFEYAKHGYSQVGEVFDSYKSCDYALDCARGGTQLLEAGNA